jgi:hypothetical protein
LLVQLGTSQVAPQSGPGHMAKKPTRCCRWSASATVGRAWALLATVAAMKRTRFLSLGMLCGKLRVESDVVGMGC